MGTSTTRKKPTANRAAFDAATKKPRITHVDVVMDTEAADAFAAAQAEYDRLESTLRTTRPQRLAEARNALAPTSSPEEYTQAASGVLAADDERLAEAQAVLDAAGADLDAATQRFKFRGLGRKRWEDLKAEHPPTEQDHANAREASGNEDTVAEYSVDSLAPALIAEASVSPRLSAEEVDVMFNGDDWNTPEIASLFQTALLAQVSASPNPRARR